MIEKLFKNHYLCACIFIGRTAYDKMDQTMSGELSLEVLIPSWEKVH